MASYKTKQYKDILRGLRWTQTVRLIKSSAWANSEDGWTWKLLIDNDRDISGSAALTLTAGTATISGTGNIYLDLEFEATEAETTALTPAGVYYIELQDTHTTNDYGWPCASGETTVRDYPRTA